MAWKRNQLQSYSNYCILYSLCYSIVAKWSCLVESWTESLRRVGESSKHKRLLKLWQKDKIVWAREEMKQESRVLIKTLRTPTKDEAPKSKMMKQTEKWPERCTDPQETVMFQKGAGNPGDGACNRSICLISCLGVHWWPWGDTSRAWKRVEAIPKWGNRSDEYAMVVEKVWLEGKKKK